MSKPLAKNEPKAMEENPTRFFFSTLAQTRIPNREFIKLNAKPQHFTNQRATTNVINTHFVHTKIITIGKANIFQNEIHFHSRTNKKNTNEIMQLTHTYTNHLNESFSDDIKTSQQMNKPKKNEAKKKRQCD